MQIGGTDLHPEEDSFLHCDMSSVETIRQGDISGDGSLDMIIRLRLSHGIEENRTATLLAI